MQAHRCMNSKFGLICMRFCLLLVRCALHRVVLLLEHQWKERKQSYLLFKKLYRGINIDECKWGVLTELVAERLQRLRCDHSVLGGVGSSLVDWKSLIIGRLRAEYFTGIREMRSDPHRLTVRQVSAPFLPWGMPYTVCANAAVFQLKSPNRW